MGNSSHLNNACLHYSLGSSQDLCSHGFFCFCFLEDPLPASLSNQTRGFGQLLWLFSLFTVAQSSSPLSPELSPILVPRRIAFVQCGFFLEKASCSCYLGCLAFACHQHSPFSDMQEFLSLLWKVSVERGGDWIPIFFMRPATFSAPGLRGNFFFFPAWFSIPHHEDYIRRSWAVCKKEPKIPLPFFYRPCLPTSQASASF